MNITLIVYKIKNTIGFFASFSLCIYPVGLSLVIKDKSHVLGDYVIWISAVKGTAVVRDRKSRKGHILL